MNKKFNLSMLTSTVLISSISVCNESLAIDISKRESIIDKDKVQDKLSRKYILPSDEDIAKMSEEQLLDEIKKYDSDIIDMMSNIDIINNQIFTLENQIKSIDKKKKLYLEKKEALNYEVNSKSSDILKIKALLNLPSVSLSKEKEEEINNFFNRVEETKEKTRKITLNVDLLDINSCYKEEYLEEIQSMNTFLNKESLKVTETKEKVKLRIEELNRREIQDSNPYSSQGVNVDIPNNINSSELVRNIIDVTAKQIGVPYVWGGTTPNGFDCSGLMQYSFGKAGIYIPRVARDQQKISRKISFEELEPGDLVFWNYPATHVALYIGDGKIIESPRTGLNVRSRYIKSTEKGINFGRILP